MNIGTSWIRRPHLIGAGLHVVCARLQGQLAQALDEEPLVEQRFPYRESLEQVASIEDERCIQQLHSRPSRASSPVITAKRG
jgi:hypothetical protein